MIGPRVDKAQNKIAGGAIGAFLIVKKGTAEDEIVISTGASDANVGALQNADGVASGAVNARIPGVGDIGQVVAGGVVNSEDYITSDGNGKAVATTTAGDFVIGRAKATGTTNDIITYEHSPHKLGKV